VCACACVSTHYKMLIVTITTCATHLRYLTEGYSPRVAHRVAICSAHRSRFMMHPALMLGL